MELVVGLVVELVVALAIALGSARIVLSRRVRRPLKYDAHDPLHCYRRLTHDRS